MQVIAQIPELAYKINQNCSSSKKSLSSKKKNMIDNSPNLETINLL